MHGDGTYVYAFSNDIYSGSWSEGKRHGQGLYEFSKDKSVLKGTWKLGEFEEGDWVMTNHITYSGKFRNGKPIGTGKFAIGHASSVSGKHMTVPVSDDGQVASIKWNSTSVLKM